MFKLELLMLILTGGGVSDLLDLVSTEAYWKAKGVTVTVEAMVRELPAARADAAEIPRLIQDLGADEFAAREAATRKLRAIGAAAAPQLRVAAKSDDPEIRTRAGELLAKLAGGAKAAAVRRLMAIRTLGELTRPEALPGLRALLDAKEPFVADYARQAMARIEGKPYRASRPPKATRWHDLALLPARCAVVAQADTSRGKPITLDPALLPRRKRPRLAAGDVAAPRPGDQGDAEQLTKLILPLAERIGNLRVDRVTVGVAGNVGRDSGFVVVVGRGQWDAGAIAAAAKGGRLKTTNVDGLPVVRVDGDSKLILCSNERIVVAAGPNDDSIPLAEVVAAAKNDRRKPAIGPDMLALLKSLDTTKPIWAAMQVTDAYRAMPLLASFATVTLVGEDSGETTALKFVARGKDPAKVRTARAALDKGVKELLAAIKQMSDRRRFLKPVAEFLGGLRAETSGTALTVTARAKGHIAALMMPAMLLTHGARPARIKEVEVPPPPPPEPIQPIPVPR